MAKLAYLKKPTFLWQALLIVLPVLVLAAVGFVSLRQDKILAHPEAPARAQAIADALIPKLGEELVSVEDPELGGPRGFEVDSAGHLAFPPPLASVPTPKPLNPAELTV